jgi:Family of unknown function (DUF5681)
MADDGRRDYPVGYGKPPRHTQFQKGRSGNPKGRPKGSLNFATALRRALLALVTVKEGGMTRKMTKFEVACRQQSNKAAAGDHRSFKLMVELLRQMTGGTDPQEPITIMISETESRL